MKKIIALLACLAVGALTFGEVVAWKGMEFGTEQHPKWLKNLVEKHDERPARKKFGIAKNARLFYGTGTAPDLENARNYAAADCMKNILGTDDGARTVSGLSPVYEYWEQDDETGYTVTVIFSREKR
ncbi:MAG: 2-hydroxyacyl-CoA dehydratase family protein [Treponemataceae bacterium]|nr:2-hydroxyacyl-CoA dehydratase family protein [Treponemataceae bacterium]